MFRSGTKACTRCGLDVFTMLRIHVAMCPEYGGKTLHHTLMAIGPNCLPWEHIERRNLATALSKDPS
jgi:hypothetical protein